MGQLRDERFFCFGRSDHSSVPSMGCIGGQTTARRIQTFCWTPTAGFGIMTKNTHFILIICLHGQSSLACASLAIKNLIDMCDKNPERQPTLWNYLKLFESIWNYLKLLFETIWNYLKVSLKVFESIFESDRCYTLSPLQYVFSVCTTTVFGTIEIIKEIRPLLSTYVHPFCTVLSYGTVIL